MSDGIDLLAPMAVDDPHRYLARWRDRAPIAYSDRHRAWIVMGHPEVAAAFRDDRLSTERMAGFARRLSGRRAVALAAAMELLEGWMLFHEPPTHTRLRAPLARQFTPRATAQLQPRIETIAKELLETMAADPSPVDLVEAFTHPLPSAVIAELFGVPDELRDWLASWSEKFGVVVFGATGRDDYEDVAKAAGEEFADRMGDLMDRYRRAPADNLLSLLLAEENRHGGLSTTEIVGACSLLLFAGHDTTSSLLGSATVALLEHPEQADAMRSATTDADLAIEEMLRYESPAKAMMRTVSHSHDRDGHRFEAGQTVVLAITAANRDPRVFHSPDRIDLARHPNPHLSFGFGHHFCLGASLARLEGRVSLPMLLRRFPNLALAGPVRWRPTISDRSPASIPIIC